MSDFSRAAIDFLRTRAAQVRNHQDYGIDLAAHLFAIGYELLARDRSARMTRSPRSQKTLGRSPEEVLGNLAALSRDTAPDEFFSIVVRALLFLENEICRRYADAEALPERTELEQILLADGSKALGGEVGHWIHPRSVLAQEREDRYQEASRRGLRHPPDPEPHPGTYLSRLGMYWHSNRELPRLSWFQAGDRTIPLVQFSGRQATQGTFRIALCPMPGEFHPIFEVLPKGNLFRAADPGMAHPEAIAAYLEELVTLAADQNVHLLVLPELMIDPTARGVLTEHLRKMRSSLTPYGVIAGSFHIAEDAEDEPRINESVLLDRAGAFLSSHRKRGRFGIPASFLKSSPDSFSKSHANPDATIFEDIRDGFELRIVETSLGRLAWLICADGIAADVQGYLPIIQRLRPDLLFIISMSHETGPFEDLMKELSKFWIGTIFVNAHYICRFGKGPLLAAYNLALFEDEEASPTRARWSYDQEEAEPIYFHAPPPGTVRDTGVSWLKRESEVFGLVVDLGVHLKKRK